MATQKKDEDEVKYLGFVRAIVIQVIVWKLNMCQRVKERSGPLKIFIQTGESFALLFLTPIYNRFKHIPHLLLLYFDNKVDKVIVKLEEIAPVLAKKILLKLEPLSKKAIKIAQNLIQETITSSVITALKESMNLLPNPLNTISNFTDAASKGLSVLGDLPLLPTDLLKNPQTTDDGDATTTTTTTNSDEPQTANNS